MHKKSLKKIRRKILRQLECEEMRFLGIRSEIIPRPDKKSCLFFGIGYFMTRYLGLDPDVLELPKGEHSIMCHFNSAEEYADWGHKDYPCFRRELFIKQWNDYYEKA